MKDFLLMTNHHTSSLNRIGKCSLKTSSGSSNLIFNLSIMDSKTHLEQIIQNFQNSNTINKEDLIRNLGLIKETLEKEKKEEIK